MPIISRVESRSLKGRILLGLLILVLAVGGLTTVYPMAVMVSGSVRSEMDETDLDLIPPYLTGREALYRKFLETKYNQSVASLNRSHQTGDFAFRTATLPPADDEQAASKRAEDLRRFVTETRLPRHWESLGGVAGVRTVPEPLRALRDRLEDRYNGDLAAFSREYGAPVSGWDVIAMAAPDWVSRSYEYPAGPLFDEYFKMQEASDPAERQTVSVSGFFLDVIVAPRYGTSSTDAYNAKHKRKWASFRDFVLPWAVPADDPVLREEWVTFVRGELNPSFVTMPDVPAATYQAMLREKHQTIKGLNQTWGSDHPSFEAITLPDGRWLRGSERQDYSEFLATQPPEAYRLVGPEYRWRQWLAKQYPSVDALNAAHGTKLASFDDARVPSAELELAYVADHAGPLRRTYASRNFINVLRGMSRQGRPLLNTLILCTLAVLLALTINPIAAYALSRFRLPSTYKVLLLLMATISFPPMVTLIPAFVMMREMNLLNTFVALLVPFAVNGYLVFLLKGFFDSLPRDIYEAALLDGASETRMFFQMTLALSKPILAVVALGAFTEAYTMFLYALIVCPERDMWVINVWLLQWQTQSSMGGVFAAVLVASVPTLLMFLLAQRVIMRGIVVPVEK